MNNALPIWVIYEKPLDFPNSFVVRRQWATTPITFDKDFILAPSLAQARAALCAKVPGLVCIQRDPSDDPCIVESWL
jgi:hypothetical protein